MKFLTPAAWCAALFLATTLFSHTVALRLLLLLGAFSMAAAALVDVRLRSSNGGGLQFAPPLLLPFALWGAWAALSLLWSLEPELSAKELRNEVGYSLLALCVCYVGAQAANAARIFLPVMALAAASVCAVALRYAWFALPESPAWLHGGSGTYSAALLTLFPCTLAFAWLAIARRWPAWFISLAAALIALYVLSGYGTLNRTLWGGLAVQIGIAACFLLARARKGEWRTMVAIVSTAAVAIAGTVAIAAKVQSDRSTVTAAATLQQDPRPQLWMSVLPRIEERPLVGSGFGRGMARHELRDEQGNANLWHSHNLFLDTVLQLGLVGLALFALLIGWTLRLGWKLARARDEVASVCGFTLIAVVAGMLIRNMTDVLWVRQSALLYWGVVGVLLAWGTRAAARAR